MKVKKMLFQIALVIIAGLGAMLGLFASIGFCVFIWGPEIMQTALGNTPDRSHPAFLIGLMLIVPSMLIGAAGCFFAIVLPLCFAFPHLAATDDPRNISFLKFIRKYAATMLKYADNEEKRIRAVKESKEE